MKNTLIVLDGECSKLESQNLKEHLGDPQWDYLELNQIEEFNDDFILGRYCLLLVCAPSKIYLQELMTNRHFKSCNIPTVFLLKSEELESIKLCYQHDFTDVFIYQGEFQLTKAHIRYTFDNYELSLRTNSQKRLRHIDPDILTKKEYQILEKIALAPLAEVSRDELKTIIWGKEHKNTNKLDVHICNLRKKLLSQNLSLRTSDKGKISLWPSTTLRVHKKITT